MRTEEEMKKLILDAANADERIRGVLLGGSRADPSRPADRYRDYDVTFFVTDVSPFWDREDRIREMFGKPSLLQKPESMKLIPPDGTGDYVYLMIFPDGNRIDLTVTAKKYENDGDPAVIWLDKDGAFPEIQADPGIRWVRKPTEKLFLDCANEFHWCLNNVAKGIARDEVSYAMEMLNLHVREELNRMLGWYVGSEHGFRVSVGKYGKYLKNYLDADLYRRCLSTYPTAEHDRMWDAAFAMVGVFGEVARKTAKNLGFRYDEAEEKGILDYMELVRRQEK